MRIVWSPRALGRVGEIADGIAEQRPLSAETWLGKIFSVVERLTDFPESGRVVPEVRRRDIREVLAGDHRVIYRADPEQASILTVRHARQIISEHDLRWSAPNPALHARCGWASVDASSSCAAARA